MVNIQNILNSYNLTTKKQMTQLKNGQNTFLQRRYKNGQQTYENMLNITNNDRNANQNLNEISTYTIRMATITKTDYKYWRGCGEIGTLCTVSRNFNGTATMGYSMEVSQKIKITISPAISLLDMYPKEKKNKISKRYLHTHVYCSIINNSQEVEAI